MECRSEIPKKIDNVFVRYREETSTDFISIRDTLQTTLVNIQKQSDDLIKQVELMKFKLNEVVDTNSEWLRQISKIRNLFESSHLTMEEIKCHQILKSIAFHDMRIRRHQIANVELAKDTFEWMVKDETVPTSHPHLKQSFASWLKEGQGIFHITGKPGSGKSTMMNSLANHPETRTQLKKWARNGNRLVIASMFLWNPGSVQQKSVDGVFRTLLYTILNDHKELVPYVFAALWSTLSEERLISWQHLEISRNEIETALRELITDSTQGYQYCLFIDGLDEFEDESEPSFSLAAKLDRWASSQSVKMCLSSRKLEPWTSYFARFPKLKIHLTTKQDIRRMIDKYLLDDRHLKSFDATESERFVSKFVDMAEGVFIWVKLVLKELEERLNYGARLGTLYKTLDTFPRDLDKFYERIVRKIPKDEKKVAEAVFDVLIETQKWIHGELFDICYYSLLGDVISCSDFYQRTSKAPEASAPIEDFRKRIPLIFRGMVEVAPWGIFHKSLDSDWLTFSHQSMSEYLSTGSKHRNPRSQIETLKMIIQCLIAKVNHYGISSVNVSMFLEDLLSRIEHAYDDSILPLLGSLDETLLRHQSKEFENLFLDFHSSPKYIPTGKVLVTLVFFRSCKMGFIPYLQWAIRNSPYWRANELFRATVIAVLSSPDEFGYYSLVEPLKVLLTDESGPNCWYSHPSFPCSLSPWTRFLFYVIAKTAYKSSVYKMTWPTGLWQVLSTFIENRADLDLVLSWTVQKTSAPFRRFYIDGIRVGQRVCHDSQHPKTDPLFFQGKKFYVSREFSLGFPCGGSARDILIYLAPEGLRDSRLLA
jgi:energy-coupling factor transporter ATP-binding protein EcfA2